MIKSNSKYAITHPLITPEYYTSEHIADAMVRSLIVYSDIKKSPDLVYDTATEALEFLFDSSVEYNIVPVHSCYRMYVDDYARAKGLPANIIATRLYRHSAMTTYGVTPKQSVYGDVLFFGSLSADTKTIDGYDHSVPYELLEQAIRLHKFYADF